MINAIWIIPPILAGLAAAVTLYIDIRDYRQTANPSKPAYLSSPWKRRTMWCFLLFGSTAVLAGFQSWNQQAERQEAMLESSELRAALDEARQNIEELKSDNTALANSVSGLTDTVRRSVSKLSDSSIYYGIVLDTSESDLRKFYDRLAELANSYRDRISAGNSGFGDGSGVTGSIYTQGGMPVEVSFYNLGQAAPTESEIIPRYVFESMTATIYFFKKDRNLNLQERSLVDITSADTNIWTHTEWKDYPMADHSTINYRYDSNSPFSVTAHAGDAHSSVERHDNNTLSDYLGGWAVMVLSSGGHSFDDDFESRSKADAIISRMQVNTLNIRTPDGLSLWIRSDDTIEVRVEPMTFARAAKIPDTLDGAIAKFR